MSKMSRVREFLARRDAVAQLAVVLGAFGAYELARLAMEPNWAQAFANANRIESVEKVLGFAWEQSLQRAFLAIPDLVAALNLFYFVGHFLLTGIFFVWLYRRSRDGFTSFRDGFIAATALAVVIHWLYPTAPPRLAGVGLEDTLLQLSGIDIGSQTSSAISNPVAAVPSLHAAYALGVGIGLVRFARSRVARVAGVLYPPLVVLTIVVTGNHFLLDAIAGMLVLAVGFLLVRGLRRRSEQPTACAA
jgi:hypothetical protein